jgi:hypothetical protein
VGYWAGNPNIDRYMRDRNSARHEIVLFFERLPHVLQPWLEKNPGRWESVIREMRHTIRFLREKGIVHFDAHFWNILADGERPYLADFGLVLDRNFALNAEEKAFLRRHADYDFAEFLSCVGGALGSLLDRLPARKKMNVKRRYEIEDRADYARGMGRLMENVEAIHAEGLMDLDGHFVEQVARHRRLITTTHDFFRRLGSNPAKDTPFPHAKVRRLLRESPFA